jgi:hypothetical protein
MTLAAGLILVALAFGLALFCARTPVPLPADAPAAEFSAGRAVALLEQLLAEGSPHPVGSEANARLRERIAGRLAALGYDVEMQEAVVCRGWTGTQATCAPVQNLAARLPGRVEGPAVMLVAHYDSVGAGPGAADDASNVAIILEIARILQAEGPRNNPVIFLFTDGEEVGLIGAQAFAGEHPWAQDLGVAINLEARGTGGQSLLFETSEDNAWLIDAVAASVPRPSANSLSYEVYKALPNDTDLTVFKAAGVAGLNFAFIERAVHYHTLLDSLENLDAGSVQHQGESVLAVARALADLDLANPPAGNAAYVDFLNRAVIRWPAAWTLPLAGAMVLILLICAGLAVNRRVLTVGGLLLGLVAALLCVVLAVLLGMGLTWLIVRLGQGSQPWYAYPLPTRLSLWAGALLCGGLMATLFGRRPGLWGLGLGAWLLWAILAVILSLTLPGAAVFLLVPGLFAALVSLAALAALVVNPRWAPAGEVALALAAAGAGMFLLPLALVLESATGFSLSPAITLFVGLAVTALLPLLALPREQAGLRRAVVVVSAAVVAGAAVTALLVPPFSEASPQPLNLYYVAEAGGAAHYVSVPAADATPPSLLGHFEDEPMAVLPWSDARYLVAAAEPAAAEGPALQILSETRSGENRTVQLLLRSPRGAGAIDLRLPAGRLASISAAGRELPVDGSAAGQDYALWCYGLACDGLEVTLELVGLDPVSVLLADSSPGLPASGEVLLQSRPATAAPYQEGDLTVIWRRVEL